MIYLDQAFANFFKNFRQKKNILKIPAVSMFFIVMMLIFVVSYNRSFIYLIRMSKRSHDPQIFKCNLVESGDRFLWYSPHSGFSNQLSEFKNAVLMASILNRTLIVPPILDHHAVALGSCPKFRVLEPSKLRLAVWAHAIELMKSGRYVSMGDIVDTSPLIPGVRFIDMRDFIPLWCGLPLSFHCLDPELPSLTPRLHKCGAVLSGSEGSGPTGCVHPVDHDCRTVVWTRAHQDGAPDLFQMDRRHPGPDQKKKPPPVYVRRRRDVLKVLGPGSKPGSSSLLAFGSLFSAPYRGSELHVDLHSTGAVGVDRLLLSEKTESLVFSPEIMRAGEELASRMGGPFFCAQLRLVDGQFKKHRPATFSGLRRELEKVVRGGSHLPVTVFLMTDLQESEWRGTYLEKLAGDGGRYDVRVVGSDDPVVVRTAREILSSGGGRGRRDCEGTRIFAPDVLLYVQEVVCGCAGLGFYGTAGSTIAETVDTIRRTNGTCRPVSQFDHSSQLV